MPPPLQGGVSFLAKQFFFTENLKLFHCLITFASFRPKNNDWEMFVTPLVNGGMYHAK